MSAMRPDKSQGQASPLRRPRAPQGRSLPPPPPSRGILQTHAKSCHHLTYVS